MSSLFDRIGSATKTVSQAVPLVEQGSRFLNDIVGGRPSPSRDDDQDDPDEDYSAPISGGYSGKRQLRSESDLRRMAETKGSMIFVMMKSASTAIKSIISRLLITKGTDDEVSELFGRLQDMADNAGVNVYQFVPTEEQMAELNITDKNLLLNEGKKAEKKRNLLKALEEEDPEVDSVFKGAVIEALYNKYREEDERGELKAEGLSDVIFSYSMVTIVGTFSNSGYNIVDMLLDLIFKKKPIIAPPRPKSSISTPPTPLEEDVQGTTALEKLVSDRSERHGEDIPGDADSPNDSDSE